MVFIEKTVFKITFLKHINFPFLIILNLISIAYFYYFVNLKKKFKKNFYLL